MRCFDLKLTDRYDPEFVATINQEAENVKNGNGPKLRERF